ncbi:enoyl-CoA hydratase/isomerase family protein [Leucobacter sp. Z1108]|uniref:enoyl-CoA hydratase/isomerase family protein n=1 Tax=Leucobacter sp. Z1108 TaxID=3439066 RepID=UPI003F36352A
MLHHWNLEEEDDVVTARFSNAPSGYCTDAAVKELENLVLAWSEDPIAGLILAGTGDGSFITHFSPDEIRAGLNGSESLAKLGPARNDRVNRLFNLIGAAPYPVVCALNGDTMGFGYELALACDLRIGEDGDFLYGLPETKLGIVPGSGGMQRLSRLIGYDRALQLVLTGSVVTPRSACDLGMVTEVAEDAVSRSREIVAAMLRNNALAVVAAKRALHAGREAPLGVALDLDSGASLRVKFGSEALRVLDAYLSLSLPERRRFLSE